MQFVNLPVFVKVIECPIEIRSITFDFTKLRTNMVGRYRPDIRKYVFDNSTIIPNPTIWAMLGIIVRNPQYFKPIESIVLKIATTDKDAPYARQYFKYFKSLLNNDNFRTIQD
jgi:hypothetical protein